MGAHRDWHGWMYKIPEIEGDGKVAHRELVGGKQGKHRKPRRPAVSNDLVLQKL